jgi:dienelactone hydrolase
VRVRRPFAVGLRVLRLVDHSRVIRSPDRRSEPRTLVTDVWYPALGRASQRARRDAPGARAAGPFGLLVFAHGFGLMPGTYATLLRAWARAGYVVAAPAFPGESANAPGGPSRTDLANEPADIRFVISRLRRASASARGPLRCLIDRREIAVGGHSDGAEAALPVAYGRPHRPRVRAAVVLAGGTLVAGRPPEVRRRGPALLAIQGTADLVEPPTATYAFFALAAPPKFLLRLLGGGHESTYELPRWRRVVERVGTAFLDRYLRRRQRGSLGRLVAAGRDAGTSLLTAKP